MPLVVDASAALAPALDEVRPQIRPMIIRIQAEAWVVPGIWWFEVRNGLLVNERRGRIAEQETARVLREFAQAAITVDAAPDEAALMELARRHRLTVYDAAYLELAVREGLAVATLDEPLARAARAENVSLVGE
ncbi:MAG: type II toxin-antitoxin system VapC family toxin [Alphaproteobacteria bacterium]|nr:type II toxin-antitoxin system VapC family toxin [Alphaproteobacteria bacterium]